MSIHDVSKTPDRATPAPNVHDAHEGLRAAHGTESVVFTTTNYPKILSTLAGGAGGGSVGITNASSPFLGRAAPPSQPVAYGQIVVGASGSTISWATIPHNLGFVPSVQAFILNATIALGDGTVVTNSGSIPLPTFNGIDINGKVGGGIVFTTWYQAIPDSTNLYIFCYNATGLAAALSITYYLYQQQAS